MLSDTQANTNSLAKRFVRHDLYTDNSRETQVGQVKKGVKANHPFVYYMTKQISLLMMAQSILQAHLKVTTLTQSRHRYNRRY